MHDHITHLIHTLLAQRSTGLALTLVAMRAHLTASSIDPESAETLVRGCQDLFRTLRTQDIGAVSIPLTAHDAVTVELHTDGSQNHYTLHFRPPASWAARWQRLYPATLTVDRWPAGPG